MRYRRDRTCERKGDWISTRNCFVTENTRSNSDPFELRTRNLFTFEILDTAKSMRRKFAKTRHTIIINNPGNPARYQSSSSFHINVIITCRVYVDILIRNYDVRYRLRHAISIDRHRVIRRSKKFRCNVMLPCRFIWKIHREIFYI